METFLIRCALAPLLGLCAAAAPAAEPAAEPYRAQGGGPAWSLTMADGRIRYSLGDGTEVALEAPAPIEDGGIRYYRAKGFQFTVMAMPCTDEASGRRYSDTVFLSVGNREHEGCGGALLAADSLDGTSWHFAEIAGEPTGLTGDVFKDDLYAIDFASDRFVGYSGCNRIGGRYRIENGIMTIDEFGSTGRGCADPRGRRERAAWKIMSAPMRVSRPAPDLLQLSGEDGTIRLKRIPE